MIITVGGEMFRCPEVLFKPFFIDKESDGIHITSYDSIMKCEVDIRKDLYGNIVLSGDTIIYVHSYCRIYAERNSSFGSINDQNCSVLIGGLYCFLLSTFQQMSS